MTVFPIWRAAPVALLAVSLVLAGCGSAPKDAPPLAERLYQRGPNDMDSAMSAPSSRWSVEGLAAGTLLAQQALLDMAYLNWRAGEKAQALIAVDRFIKLNPSSPAQDDALYLKGVINFNDNLGLLGSLAGQDLSERDQRASRDSWQAFKQLLDQFPNSAYSADARQRMAYTVNSLAAYEVNVARYYRRGAYVAAASRAQQAVADFQQAPAIEEALHLLVQSYDKLELPELRDAASRVLRRNFPQSAFLGGPGARSEKPWWRFW
jgi:outer membrane protein assembly factor BamD